MATKKVAANKQPENDPKLKSEVHSAVQDAAKDAKTGNVSTSEVPTGTYQGHDRR